MSIPVDDDAPEMSMETIHIIMIHAAHCYIPPLFGDVINTMNDDDGGDDGRDDRS